MFSTALRTPDFAVVSLISLGAVDALKYQLYVLFQDEEPRV
jgi:hypothetical protein